MGTLKNSALALAIGSLALLGAGTTASAQHQPNARQAYQSPSQANQDAGQESANRSNMAVPARLFAKKAAQDDLAEIKMGTLAQQKGGTPAVRDFGQRLVRDHTKNLDELKSVAQQQNITLPTEPNSTQMIDYKNLSSLNTAEFDKKFARHMVNDHVRAVTEFKAEAKNGTNPQIKNFAAKSVPVLETHLRLARNMMNSANARTSTGQSGSEL
ncbi:MAG TPA: DUF4142 domain-containing protein [Candidatus Acidoferrales bacterium]|nr:DUF4142 domain-containing protein [Candidatus Acidoferrales bacterium]